MLNCSQYNIIVRKLNACPSLAGKKIRGVDRVQGTSIVADSGDQVPKCATAQRSREYCSDSNPITTPQDTDLLISSSEMQLHLEKSHGETKSTGHGTSLNSVDPSLLTLATSTSSPW